ncbi:hypothetical protein [Streptomyces sp. NPDC056682]|uniref:hypothetical protein n=1 Tax=Streptomyces sp. NPDC056682 TaxID=3345909 RepID=UPI0036A88516
MGGGDGVVIPAPGLLEREWDGELRRATSRTELDAQRHTAKEAAVAFVTAAATLLSPNNH